MTVLLKRVLIFPSESLNNYAVDYSSSSKKFTEITDDENIQVKCSMGNKSGTLTLSLKNNNAEHVRDSKFKFKQEDVVKVFLKETDNPTDDPIDITSSDDLIMTAEIEEYEAELSDKSTAWHLDCVNKAYVMLNKLWAKAYTRNETHTVYGSNKVGWTPPEIIKHILEMSTMTGKNTSQIKADFVSRGGYIQDTRPDGSSFEGLRSELSIAKVFKPIHEWTTDLSSVDRTNTAAEIAGTLVCTRPFIFFLDENNAAHWEHPNTDTPEYEMTVGSTVAVGSDTLMHNIIGHKIKKATFDIINLVIFNAGEDFTKSGTLGYYYDSTTTSPKLKPKYQPMLDIANEWKKKEITGANSAKYTLDNDTGTLLWEGRKYNADYTGGGFKPVWANSSTDSAVTNDTELNTSLRTFILNQGKNSAQKITQKRANPRWKGTITLRGKNYRVGELIKFNSAKHGIVDAYVRITDVSHTCNKSGWTAVLNVEEDEKERV